MEMTRLELQSAAPLGTTELESIAALQRNELPEVPSHGFTTGIQHDNPRLSHVSREVDNASLSSTAVNEADPISIGNPPQKIVNGIQQTHTPPTPPFNSPAPTYLDKCFAEPESQHEASREPPISNALQASPKSASVGEPAAAAGRTQQRDMLEATSQTHEPVIKQVNNEVIPNLNEGPPGPESHQDKSSFKSTAAERLEQASNNVSHQISLQGGASIARRNDLPQSSSMIPRFLLTARVADGTKSNQPAASTRSERPELLSSDTYVVVEEEPPEEKRKMWEEGTKRELDAFLHILAKSIRKSMLATRLCMAYMKGDEKRIAKPVIIITCNTRKCSKKVHKHLSGRPTLRCLELFQVSVTVKVVKLAALSDEETPVPAPRSLPIISIGTDGNIGNIKHKSERLTYCGRNLRIEVWQDGVGKPSFAKFGGVISVKGKFYGITTAHSLLLNPYHDSESELSDDDDEAILSAAAFATSPSTSADSGSVTDSEPGSVADSLRIAGQDGEEFESLAYLQPLSNMAYSYQGMTMKPGGTRMRASSMSDWALFPLQPSVALPNSYETRSLTSVAPESQLMAGPVSILLGIDAPCEGYLTSPTASLHTEHALMNVREIMLKSTLPKGASGAWVVRGAEVCGYVVALIGEGLSCLMIPMERTFREIRELFGSDVELGPELHDRIRENRHVDVVLESLIAATQRAGEALEEFRQNIKLYSGADPDSITALREPKHQKTTSGPSHKAGSGTDPKEAVNPAAVPLRLDLNEKTELAWKRIAEHALDVAATCADVSDAFLKLASRWRSQWGKFSYSGTFDHLFTTTAQSLNMMHLAWSRIGDWSLKTPGHWPSYFDTLQRSLNITSHKLEFLTTRFRPMFSAKDRSLAQAIRQAIDTVLWKAELIEFQRSVKSLADDAIYLQDQCPWPASRPSLETLSIQEPVRPPHRIAVTKVRSA